jgi:H2C2 zinc finger
VCKIWDALGFKRIGRVKGCGNLKSYPGRLIDAIIYGRDLGPGSEGEELVSEERFDKIKFYLKYGKYPNGADRAEKSRLRSAATHYKLVEDKLMLKDKEVISDPGQQYEIAREVHVASHAGINKSTATIAEKFHWSGIKQTVSDVIRNCVECKELGKTPLPGGAVDKRRGNASVSASSGGGSSGITSGSVGSSRLLGLRYPLSAVQASTATPSPYADPSNISVISPSHTLQHPSAHHNPMLQDQPELQRQHHHHSQRVSVYQPIDQPIDPQIINQPSSHHSDHHNPFEPYHSHSHGLDHDHTDTDFRELLRAAQVDDHEPPPGGGPDGVDVDAERAAVDRDLDMLIEHEQEDDVDDVDEEMGGVGDGDERSRRDESAKSRGIYHEMVPFGGAGL